MPDLRYAEASFRGEVPHIGYGLTRRQNVPKCNAGLKYSTTAKPDAAPHVYDWGWFLFRSASRHLTLAPSAASPPPSQAMSPSRFIVRVAGVTSCHQRPCPEDYLPRAARSRRFAFDSSPGFYDSLVEWTARRNGLFADDLRKGSARSRTNSSPPPESPVPDNS